MMKVRLRCLLVCAMLLVIARSNFAQVGDDRARQNESAKVESAQMELTIFARFHAREGKEEPVAAELHDAVARVREEPGGLGIEVYRSVRDSRLVSSILVGSMKQHSISTWRDPKPINSWIVSSP